jgi:hypothetical protein
MKSKLIKQIFRDFWYVVCVELASVYSSLHWKFRVYLSELFFLKVLRNLAKMRLCYGNER